MMRQYGSPSSGHADAWRSRWTTPPRTLGADWPRGAVTRATLGGDDATDDDMGGKLIHATRYFESRGWFDAGRVVVFVHEPEALRDYALSGYSNQPMVCGTRERPQALAAIHADDSG